MRYFRSTDLAATQRVRLLATLLVLALTGTNAAVLPVSGDEPSTATAASTAGDAAAGDAASQVIPESIRILPPQVLIQHPRQPQSLIVTGLTSSGYTVDLGEAAKFVSADPNVATASPDGWVRPVRSGATELTITVPAAGGAVRTFQVPVQVALPAETPARSFRHEVMPVFSKAGCNLGACHGYSLGKNGFKLSLRGQEAEPDFVAVTRDAYGRRVDFARPDASLLVAKPLGTVPHEGGVRFSRGSLPFEILTDWVAQGAPADLADTREVVAVRVTPARLVLSASASHRLQLIAEYSDGSLRDVTELGSFSVNNDQYASVTAGGVVTAGDWGETAVVARFERKFAAVDVIVRKDVPGFQPTPEPTDRFIDRLVIRKLNELKIEQSSPAPDEMFLRRVSLDLIGLQPSADEVRAFVADSDPDKRAKAIDRLMQRPEFVDHWSLKWGDLLQNSRNVLSPTSMYLFREWIRAAVASNMPLDEFARQLLTARGGAADDPASSYLAISKDANETVERTTQVFCGVRMLCARCHSHPMENWTQADYYGVASFFNQLSTKNDPRQGNQPNARVLLVNGQAGAATNPRTGRPQPPRFLGGGEPTLAPGIDRRKDYATWLTSPENPYFARGLANRLWSYFFHRGIVDPVDDVRSTNPPINPELLDALTRELVEHRFDARHLIRTIVLSRTYQASSLPTPGNESDTQNFSHAIPRRVPAEALLDSLVQATGVKENFGGAPGGFSAAQLPDANVTSDFLALFGKPQRMEACECERDGGSNMLQALHLINGQAILGKVSNPSGRVAQLVKQHAENGALIGELYLWALARRPTEQEVQLGIETFQSYGDKRTEAAQDLTWALLNSRDFMLVH